MAHNNALPDRPATQAELIELLGAGAATRTPLGDDALWASA
jgi:hypothetical protein